MLVHDFLINSAARLPDKVALVCDGHRMTYRDLDLMTNRLARALVEHGVGRGDRVAIFMLHLQKTFSDVVKTDKTGLSKTAHTRWMISAFANFLPGSTIFRLA